MRNIDEQTLSLGCHIHSALIYRYPWHSNHNANPTNPNRNSKGNSSPALYLLWQCCAYGQYKVQNRTGLKTGEMGPLQLQSNKVNDSINYHFIKHHAWVRYSTRCINKEK